MSDARIVLTTCPNHDSARKLAEAMVQSQLAACVNLVAGVESWYRWEGEVQSDAEVQLIIKTEKNALDELFNLVLSIHPYDLPEWLIIAPDGGSQAYLEWIKSSLK